MWTCLWMLWLVMILLEKFIRFSRSYLSENISLKNSFLISISIFSLSLSLGISWLYNLNFEIFTPYIFILVSILLISKVPTYSMKKIVVPRSTTVFLLFGIVLLFGLLLVFTFEVIVISCMVYILSIPISIYHYMKLKKKYSITSGNEDDELEDVL